MVREFAAARDQLIENGLLFRRQLLGRDLKKAVHCDPRLRAGALRSLKRIVGWNAMSATQAME